MNTNETRFTKAEAGNLHLGEEIYIPHAVAPAAAGPTTMPYFVITDGGGNGSWITQTPVCPDPYPTPIYVPVATSGSKQ